MSPDGDGNNGVYSDKEESQSSSHQEGFVTFVLSPPPEHSLFQPTVPEHRTSPMSIPEQDSSSPSVNCSSPLTSSDRVSSPLSSGGSAEVSDKSTSPDNVLTDNLSGLLSASWMNTNKGEKEGNHAAFNRVVGDAPQRAHIRLKPRHHHHRTSDKDKESDDISSDSSSYHSNPPPTIPNLSKIGTQTPDVTLESEGSSESGTFFRPTHVVRHLVKHSSKKRHDVMSASDAGIVTCSSSTSASQSCLSVSRGESSGQDAGDSGMVSRNSSNSSLRKAPSKRSLAGHYQAIKRSAPKINNDLPLVKTAITTHMKTMPTITTEDDLDCNRDRKRRRFNRTFGALRQCGLLELTLQTAALMETSQRMQNRIETLRNETKTLHDAMFQFAEVQPNFLTTSKAQQIMSGLGEMAHSPIDNTVTPVDDNSLLATDSVSQILKGALDIQWHHQTVPVVHPECRQLAPNPSSPSQSGPKKQKHGYNSACSSQMLTSTEPSSPTTDSDEIQKRLLNVQHDGYKEQWKL